MGLKLVFEIGTSHVFLVKNERKSKWKFFFVNIRGYTVDRDSSVGIATGYGLDGPRIESRWGRDFPHPPRPGLGPTQPHMQQVLGLSRG